MSEQTEIARGLIREVDMAGKSGSLAEADAKIQKVCKAIEQLVEGMNSVKAEVPAPVVASKKVAK